ncbi:hypothetical protein SEA_BRYNNIE_59 [Arthrobacter phage Brynnie]|nr:hypothetical protein SEA_BRYNNIE_59 [Arthrobacter phage Brynnie]
MTSKHEPGIPVTFEGEVVGRAIMHGDGTQAAIFVTGDIADRLRGGDVGGFSIAEDVAGAPSPSAGPVPEPVAGLPCGCVPGEKCHWCRFGARPSMRERNWEAIQDELGVDLRGNPRPGFKRAPFPFPVRVDTEVRPGVVRIEGNGQRVDVEVDAVLCSTSSHAGTVPAVVFGEFRVPWWSAERTEPAAYCSACARMLGFMGYFTPDEVTA